MSKVLIDRSVVEQAQMWIPLLTEMVGLDPETTSAEFSEFSDGRPASAFTIANVIAALRAALKQPQVGQEPAIYPEEAFDMGLEAIPYYTHPQHKREPLTDAQINAFFEGMESNNGFWLSFARAIERAHGIGGES